MHVRLRHADEQLKESRIVPGNFGVEKQPCDRLTENFCILDLGHFATLRAKLLLPEKTANNHATVSRALWRAHAKKSWRRTVKAPII